MGLAELRQSKLFVNELRIFVEDNVPMWIRFWTWLSVWFLLGAITIAISNLATIGNVAALAGAITIQLIAFSVAIYPRREKFFREIHPAPYDKRLSKLPPFFYRKQTFIQSYKGERSGVSERRSQAGKACAAGAGLASFHIYMFPVYSNVEMYSLNHVLFLLNSFLWMFLYVAAMVVPLKN
jgi:hypothetical protein